MEKWIFLHLFDREDDHSSSKFTMKWNKWSESCRFEEEAPNEEQKIILTNPIKAWVVQRRKCNVKNHFKKTGAETISYRSSPFYFQITRK